MKVYKLIIAFITAAVLWVMLPLPTVASDLGAITAITQADKQELWMGRGTAYDPDLQRVSGYSVAVMNTRVDELTITSVIVTTPDDGFPRREVCTLNYSPTSRTNTKVSFDCTNGTGEGVFFGSIGTSDVFWTDGRRTRSYTSFDDGNERRRVMRETTLDEQLQLYAREDLERVR